MYATTKRPRETVLHGKVVIDLLSDDEEHVNVKRGKAPRQLDILPERNYGGASREQDLVLDARGLRAFDEERQALLKELEKARAQAMQAESSLFTRDDEIRRLTSHMKNTMYKLCESRSNVEMMQEQIKELSHAKQAKESGGTWNPQDATDKLIGFMQHQLDVRLHVEKPDVINDSKRMSEIAIRRSRGRPWICQFNEVHQTHREIARIDGKWMYDSVDRKAQPYDDATWDLILDDRYLNALETHFGKTLDVKNETLVYISLTGSNWHVWVQTEERPWLMDTEERRTHMLCDRIIYKSLYEHTITFPTHIFTKKMINSIDNSAEPFRVPGNALATLTQTWSSVSMKFEYDNISTELWVKPSMLTIWLTEASLPNKAIVFVGHGSNKKDSAQSSHWHGMCKSFERDNCLYGKGTYVSILDAIPNSYTQKEPGSRGAQRGVPRDTDITVGTMFVGMLIVDTDIVTRKVKMTVDRQYNFYHLNLMLNEQNFDKYFPAKYGMNKSAFLVKDSYKVERIPDAIVVFDRMRLLMLGKAVGRA